MIPDGLLELDDSERAIQTGEMGPGAAMAMELVITLARVTGARRLVGITAAHIDGCLYHGTAGVDFVARLAEGGAAVSVPTTLNVSSLDLLHPELYRGDPASAAEAKRLMDLHVELGCRPTWTCAPYQLPERPALGDQIAWGESNAIVFANSVLGARTNRYGDFADLACAIVGKAPMSGLHTDEGRSAGVVVELDVDDDWLDHDIFYTLLGYWVGANCGTTVPAIVGLDARASEERLKALGATAASSGATAMFHAVGVTPEASDEIEATGGRVVPRMIVGGSELREIRARLGARVGALGAVSVGAPHLAASELEALAALVQGKASTVPFYVNTSRASLEAVHDGTVEALAEFGATIVVDTCTYITPIIGDVSGLVLTDSGKWAYYAPGNLGHQVAFGSSAECVESAVAGQLVLTDPFLS